MLYECGNMISAKWQQILHLHLHQALSELQPKHINLDKRNKLIHPAIIVEKNHMRDAGTETEEVRDPIKSEVMHTPILTFSVVVMGRGGRYCM